MIILWTSFALYVPIFKGSNYVSLVNGTQLKLNLISFCAVLGIVKK